MVLDAVLAVVGGALLFYVPGYLLTKACWPRKDPVPELGIASVPLMAVALSMSVTITVTSFLGFLPHPGDRGFYQTWRTGIPFIELSLLLLSAAFFVIAAKRGAFPRLAKRSARRGGILAEGGFSKLGDTLKRELVDGRRKEPPTPPV